MTGAGGTGRDAPRADEVACDLRRLDASIAAYVAAAESGVGGYARYTCALAALAQVLRDSERVAGRLRSLPEIAG